MTVVHLARHADGTAARPTGRHVPRAARWRISASACCSASRRRLFSATARSKACSSPCGSELEADLVVIAAGIRPNADLGRKAGLEVNRGIVVNDYMETSHPDIFAVGECTEHRGQIFGLVAPLLEQGKVLAATITGNRGPVFTRRDSRRQAQDHGRRRVLRGQHIDESEPGVEVVRYEDPSLGVYKKLLLKDNRLHGVILVGDASDDQRYSDWLRTGTDLTPHRRHLLFPPPAADTGLDVAQMPDSETVCGCIGVTKGDIIARHPRARHQHHGPAEGPHSRLHRLRQLRQPLRAVC